MNLANEATATDEYFVTAHQIFDCCGIEGASTLRVDSLMDKFTSFVKTNKLEFSFLKTILDPEECNPEITVTKLANALHQYSENHKSKMDLDESFNNLRCGQAPHDSDSGISTDGLLLLEELHCELKEKEHMAQQLRSQLDFTDRQHEETTAALTAERDSLKRHLNMLREENATLCHVRRDYDEVCERLQGSAVALDEASRELEGMKRRVRVSRDQVAVLETDKLSLQDLLSKSKDECHRINEMYATRQSALLGENEALKSQHAELSSRLQDQDEFMKQVLKEKLLLEMELKDMLNKSNQTHSQLNQSIELSYTEDQMLTALDSLNADSRFSRENRILDEDSFMNALRDDPDPGRSTNISLYDEIRMSFNISRLNATEFNSAHCDKCSPDNSLIATGTQTDHLEPSCDCGKGENSLKKFDSLVTAITQTINEFELYDECDTNDNSLNKASTETQTDECKNSDFKDESVRTCVETQTNENEPYVGNSKVDMVDWETQTNFALEVTENKIFPIQKTDLGIQTENKFELYCDEDNAQICKNCVNVNRKLDFEISFQDESYGFENNTQYKDFVNVTLKVDMEIQTEVTMQNELCPTENNAQFLDAKDYTNTATQTVGEFIRKRPNFVKKAQKLLKQKGKYRTAETQTDEIEPSYNNNNAHCTKCLECDDTKYTNKLQKEVEYSNLLIKEMEAKITEYENNLTSLEALIGQEKVRNEKQQGFADDLLLKMDVLERACITQRDVIDKITSTDVSCAQSQTEFDVACTSSQADLPCSDCEKRKAIAHRGLRKFFWEPLKCLFQMFAILCFLGAVSLLYGVSQRGRVRCDRGRGVTPWRWFDVQDVMDLLLRIEYTAEVPM